MIDLTDVIDAGDLPEACVLDCSGPGDATQAVEYWLSALDWISDRDKAVSGLLEYGAWEAEELASWTDEELAMRLLWLAAGTFREGETLFSI